MDGPSFYDQAEVFERYMRMRESAANANETLEGSEVEDLVGDPRGLRVLDLGCGAGAYGRRLLDAGATRYVGIDGSAKMVASARALLEGTAAELVEADLATARADAAAFDLVISRLVLHYLANLHDVLAMVCEALAPRGRFIFSVEHPVITSCARGWSDGPRQDWIVDDYFVSGARETDWMGGKVTKYHRTLEDYWTALREAEFVVDQIREGRPRPALFGDAGEYQRRTRIPLFLIVAAHKA
jgi:SAM-dependent methyltransferase